MDGENLIGAAEVKKGQKAEGSINNPTKNESALIGWKKGETSTVVFDFTSDGAKITEDTIFYAQWKDATANLTYAYVDGTTNQLTVSGSGCSYSDNTLCIPAISANYSNATVTKIGSSFSSDASIITVYLPHSITTIDANAFSGFSNLAKIYYGGTKESFNKTGRLTISQSITVYCSDGTLTLMAPTT